MRRLPKAGVMRLSPRGLCLLLALAGWTGLLAIERLPIEDFARQPDTLYARLSPDGRSLAFLRDRQSRTLLHVVDLDSGKMHFINPGYSSLAHDAPKEFNSFTWVGPRRIVATTTVYDALFGMLATDIDGSKVIGISGYEEGGFGGGRARLWEYGIIHRCFDATGSILMLDRHVNGGGSPNRPSIIKVDTATGYYKTVEKNPGEVARWGLDEDGVARLGILSHGDLSGAIYRDGANAPWKTILPLKNRKNAEIKPLGFDHANNRVFVAALTAARRWSVFPLNPTDGSLGAPLFEDPVYDIVPASYSPSLDGVPLTGPVFSSAKKALVGVRFYNDAPRVKWFDKDYQKYQRSVDKALPNTVNVIINESEDGQRLLWLAFSDQDPGAYYLMDVAKPSFSKVAVRMAWINPAQMASVRPFHYTARDGLVIHGYLTIPAGHEPKNLPMIIMPHGGPWVRDAWNFDPLVQLLANRGYAVMQMNYRGSPGYGYELDQKARRQIGGEIQNDIEDATRWAIAAGVADPKQLAIMGASYGGYSTLFALGKTPDLYRCGISIAGVTDWPAIYEDSDVSANRMAKQHWKEEIGDPGKDLARLREISPVNFAELITAPVLIIQGKEDVRVPQDQAKRMVSALEKVGRKPESLFIPNLGHSYGDERQRLQIFQSVVTFLEANLGPGVN